MNEATGRRPLRLGACLSLTGPYARFGGQAAAGLEGWRRLDGGAEVVVEDDGGDASRLAALLPGLAARCDLVLGPYSTRLMRRAATLIGETGGLLWNHGGAGDDVQAAAPGHVVSVLAPASRYASPFLERLAERGARAPLWLVEGSGRFGHQVCAGADAAARAVGLETVRARPDRGAEGEWDLLCAGSFEEDVAAVTAARALPRPPRTVCAVAAGVREFGEAVAEPDGILGVAQWFPGRTSAPGIGPTEPDFLAAYRRVTGAAPDYPAVQAAAAAALAAHCARTAGGLGREGLWRVAVGLDCDTLFGAFRIDPVTGAQTGHRTVLVRWTAEGATVGLHPGCRPATGIP
jgi:ABC-type branched-subunit amino acid transport system substrate-binding protein